MVDLDTMAVQDAPGACCKYQQASITGVSARGRHQVMSQDDKILCLSSSAEVFSLSQAVPLI